ncbi:Uncharacterised protein [Zhongshania aliphaticivorans]|uniref:Uncharacterized protein n=1 Tax=Zhongshania aliphaticivorans TaxID=1470434 RepID=A0A5S9Q8C5_9GAMM|nr:hypothetical protein [Zhongshania aliphaticivorans]CAA0102437.1 Uncharacterised protein [Zhongshania aliphaticivorans]CAA0114259.1 Uncharacterised protein [Zhongshania aliphaticivorans]
MDDFYSPAQRSVSNRFTLWREQGRRKQSTEIDLATKSPAEYQNLKNSTNKPDVFLVPRDKTRSSLLGLHPKNNPFVQTLREFDQGHQHFAGSAMERHYTSFQPQSMAVVLGLADSESSKLHPDAAVLPWWAAADQSNWRNMDAQQRRLRYKYPKRYGLDANVDYGCQFYGPVSKGVGELEYQRHVKTHQLILKNGYLPYMHGHLTGQFLVSENDWVWVCHKGNHRYVSLLALGLERIPVVFNSKPGSSVVVQRNDVSHWPNVTNGLFSEDEALQVFDRFISTTNK